MVMSDSAPSARPDPGISPKQRSTPQIQCSRVLRALDGEGHTGRAGGAERREIDGTRRVAAGRESARPPGLGLVGVDGEPVVGPAAGMTHVIGAASERATA